MGGWGVGVGSGGAGRRGRQKEGLMVMATAGGQLQPETYDRHTQSHTQTQAQHLGNPSAPSHTQKDPWRGSD